MTITPPPSPEPQALPQSPPGLLFIGVQIGHPELNATSITTTNVYIRAPLKVLMAVLALVGITGMYLSQIRRNGILGLVGTCCWQRDTC